MIALKVLTKLSRWLWHTVAAVVIGYAILVVLGRLLLPSLDNYRDDISSYLSGLLEMDVQVERLSGTWPRLAPILSADGVEFKLNDNSDGGIAVSQISAELSLFESIWEREPIWKQLHLGKVSLVLEEDANGQWSIAGVPLAEGGGGFDPLGVLLYSSLIQIDQIKLALNFYSGTSMQFSANDIKAENNSDFHRVVASLKDSQGVQLARLVFEATGDHNVPDSFDAKGYLKLNRINIGGGINAVARQWFPKQIETIGKQQTQLNSELWFDVKANGQATLVGKLSADTIPLAWASDLPPLTDLSAKFTGWYHPGTDWGLTLQGLDFGWGDYPVKPLDIRFGQRVGARWGEFGLDVNHINLGVASELLKQTGLLPEKALEMAQAMNPRGTAERVSVDFSQQPDRPPILVRAHLQDVGIDPWRGVPGAEGLDGYLEMSGDNGLFVMDATDFSVDFDSLYDHRFEVGKGKGTVQWEWQRERSEIRLATSEMNFSLEPGDIHAQLMLELPLSRPDDAPQMMLQLGARNVHSRYRSHYTPELLSDNLRAWLDQAVGDSNVDSLGVIFRGSLRKGDQENRTVQLFADVSSGELTFLSDWPVLSEYTGTMVVDDYSLYSSVSKGNIGGLPVSGSVTYKDQRLNIKANSASDIATTRKALQVSPLNSYLAGFEQWQASGDINGELNMEFILDGNKDTNHYQVSGKISDVRLFREQLGVEFTRIRSDFLVNENGIHIPDAHGLLWGAPINLSFTSDKNNFKLDANGEVDVEKIHQHYQLQNSVLLSGRTRLSGSLKKDPETSELVGTLNSDLEGLAIQLPAPFGKTTQQKRSLIADIRFKDNLQLEAKLEGGLRAGAKWIEGKLSGGYLGINRSDLTLPNGNYLQIAADIKTIDIKDWQAELNKALKTAKLSAQSIDSFPVHFDARVGELIYSDWQVRKAHLKGSFEEGQVALSINSDQVAGTARIPLDSNQSVVVELDDLRLPELKENDGSETADNKLEDFDPRTLRAMEIAVNHLFVGDRELGDVSFKLNPTGTGLKVSNIDATLFGLDIGGEGTDTEMEWVHEAAFPRTRFNGLLQTDNLAAVLDNLGVGAVLGSENAVFRSRLLWPGAPWKISPKNLYGQISFAMEEGSFYQDTNAPTNAFIRVVSLFNFETWLRRLKFDFSDLYSKGISYDTIKGSLWFDEGLLSIREPLVAELPSGTMQMQGDIDLNNENIDARIVATLPVGTNLPWMAALAINLPAAAGVWLVSKVFDKQLDSLSSISYRVKGSWDEPEVSVEKVFQDPNRSEKKAAEKKARKAAQQSDSKGEK
ncbi:AsmA-like C-terminal region-containing protein [Porticoccaceae bacterium LTM1]|nr:AsmA-like C-terminal region-containing protein [Porticoccaceae bacterium LTM1]